MIGSLVFLGIIPGMLIGFVPVFLVGTLLPIRVGWPGFAVAGLVVGGILAIGSSSVEEIALVNPIIMTMFAAAFGIALVTFWHLEKEAIDG